MWVTLEQQVGRRKWLGRRSFRCRSPGYEGFMSNAWLIAAIPGTLALMAALLALSGFVEQHFLSPRSLILGAARARRNTPEYAEAFVARQFDRLLLEQGGRRDDR